MEFTIKNLKHSEFASQETNCFEATLYADGKAECIVSNDGHGGADHYHPLPSGKTTNGLKLWERIAELEAEAAKQTYLCDYRKEQVPHSLETLVGDLVTAELYRRELKRKMSRFALFKKAGQAGIYETKYAAKRKPDDSLFALLRQRHPGATILNELPEAEALAIWRNEAA